MEIEGAGGSRVGSAEFRVAAIADGEIFEPPVDNEIDERGGGEDAVGDRELLGDLLLAAAEVAKKLDLRSGFRVVVNSGPDAGESVPHLHVHVLGQRQMSWPPG